MKILLLSIIIIISLTPTTSADECLSCHTVDDYMLEEQTTCNDCHSVNNHREVCTNCHPITNSITYHQLHNATCDTCHPDAKKSQVSFSTCTICHIKSIDNIHVKPNVTSITKETNPSYERFTLYTIFQNLWSQLTSVRSG